MDVYTIYLSTDGTFSCVMSGPFADDQSAISYLINLQQGLYKIEKWVQVDTETINKTVILDQTQ